MVVDRIFCIRFFAERQNVVRGRSATIMSYELRSRSLGRYDGGNRSFAEQRSGRGIASASLGGSGGRSVRTSTSAVDSWASDDDITDTAWRRSVQSSSSSTNRGQSTTPVQLYTSPDTFTKDVMLSLYKSYTLVCLSVGLLQKSWMNFGG